MNLERIPEDEESLKYGERTPAPTARTARDTIPAMRREVLLEVLEGVSEIILFQELLELISVFLFFFMGFIR